MYSGVIHFRVCCLFLLAIPATFAASSPTTSTDDDTLPSHSEASTAAPSRTRHALHLASHSHTHSPSHILNPQAAEPTAGLTSPHDSPPFHLPSSQAHKGLTVIIFATIGGLIALLFLALCARRAFVHCRTPRHDAVLTVVERAQLVREIAEYTESASRRQRHSLIGPPPPPYEPAPSYDSLTPHRS